ncbi:heavy-metal-associated domain-containing protein [Streptomyces sp. NPDC018693]|uniref:heavy-metal-associated domain-containing protein n=1 Tax=unclassified Streptomyces TaxID=2593676 RepID=UPI0037A2487E
MSGRELAAETRATTYGVAGMVCNNCRTAVTEAISEVADVVGVDVDLAAGQVTVTTVGAPDEPAIAAAVDEAGYELSGQA